MIQRNSKIWESHEALGLSCKKVGPLPEKQVEFVKMAITASQTLETAFKAMPEKPLKVGLLMTKYSM